MPGIGATWKWYVILFYLGFGQEIKRCLLLGRKAMTNLDSVLKSRDITLLKNVCTVKAMFFHYSCMDVRRQRAKELMLFNCRAGEDS